MDMFKSFDPEQWQKLLMDRMDQYFEQINAHGKQKPDKVKRITAEGRVFSPHCKDSVCSVCNSARMLCSNLSHIYA